VVEESRSKLFLPSVHCLAAFRSVEDHPNHEVIGKLLESMLYPGRNEQDIAGSEAVTLPAIPEHATALHNGIDLIATVG